MSCTKKELERAKKYRQKNREKINTKRREYYIVNAEKEKKKALPRSKEWYKKNASKKKEYDIIYKRRIDVVARNLFLWMKYRVKRQKSYKTRKIEINRDEFVKKALTSPQFKKVFKKWEKNNYIKKLRPSVDRIDNNKGYTASNIQFLSMIDNVNKFWKKDRPLG